jgi:hypothetical protein
MSIPIIILIAAIWELYWTIEASWEASKRGHRKWFIFFIAVSLLGLPEIYYLKIYCKKNHLT